MEAPASYSAATIIVNAPFSVNSKIFRHFCDVSKISVEGSGICAATLYGGYPLARVQRFVTVSRAKLPAYLLQSWNHSLSLHFALTQIQPLFALPSVLGKFAWPLQSGHQLDSSYYVDSFLDSLVNADCLALGLWRLSLITQP